MKLGIFTSGSCGDGKEMYKKRVIHMKTCCFANLNLLLSEVLVAIAVFLAIAPNLKTRRP